MGGITGVAGQMKALRQHLKDLEELAVIETHAAARTAMITAFGRTPVWSGETVRNYRWGAGTQVPAGRISPVGDYPSPNEKTNTLPLGPESGRAPNEAAALQDMASVVSGKKLRSYTLTNTISAEKWDLIDNGSAPSPGTARNKGGVTKLVRQAVKARGDWK